MSYEHKCPFTDPYYEWGFECTYFDADESSVDKPITDSESGADEPYTDEPTIEDIKRDSMLLEKVTNQTPEICAAAVKQNGLAIRFVQKKLCMSTPWLTDKTRARLGICYVTVAR